MKKVGDFSEIGILRIGCIGLNADSLMSHKNGWTKSNQPVSVLGVSTSLPIKQSGGVASPHTASFTC